MADERFDNVDFVLNTRDRNQFHTAPFPTLGVEEKLIERRIGMATK